MSNFRTVLQTGKFLSSVVILIFIFALFDQHFRSPLDYSLLILYGYFILIQIATAVTLLLDRVREITKFHVNIIYITLTVATIIGFLFMILFSAPLVRIVSCCVYDISGFEGITSDLTFDCSSLTCDESIVPIALPTLIFFVCALWTHQQIYNVRQYLYDRNRELEAYTHFVLTPANGAGPQSISDPYDVEVSSIMS